ncbi:hypothetical protein E4H04_12955 [Candidatus Bathyarchaeota archaeon]|nr:MAG: hypothetical protein E4H04_12955 [Candidatus Bathyarchaeota archaeon]
MFTRGNRGIILGPILTVLFAVLLFVFPMSPLNALATKDKIQIILSITITIFAIIEGASIYSQVTAWNKRNLIEDTRNELENAFGPLYDIFNEDDRLDAETRKYQIILREKLRMDNIFSTRPYMFKEKTYTFWKKEVSHLQLMDETFLIPKDFVDLVIEEYEKKVALYFQLLEKNN